MEFRGIQPSSVLHSILLLILVLELVDQLNHGFRCRCRLYLVRAMTLQLLTQLLLGESQPVAVNESH